MALSLWHILIVLLVANGQKSKLSNTFSKSVDTVSIRHSVKNTIILCINKIAKFGIVN